MKSLKNLPVFAVPTECVEVALRAFDLFEFWSIRSTAMTVRSIELFDFLTRN